MYRTMHDVGRVRYPTKRPRSRSQIKLDAGGLSRLASRESMRTPHRDERK